MIKNYFFDFDKTLANTGNVSVTATEKAFKAFNLTVPSQDQILDKMGIPAEVSFPQMAKQKLSDKEIKQLVQKFRAFYQQEELDNTELYPGIKSLLSQLQQAKKQLFIVSSKATQPLKRNLSHLGILDCFTMIEGCDLVTKFKPDPEGINLLIQKFDLKKSESIMIGDARYDLQMGKNAGVKTCGATWGAFNVKSLVAENPTYMAHQPLDILQFSQED